MKVKYKSMPFTKCDDETRKKLLPLTLRYGAFRSMLLNTPQRFKHIVMASNQRNKILGWSAVFMWGDISVGVYVDEKYRHKGIGKKLKNMAVRKALKEDESVTWFLRGHDGSQTAVTVRRKKAT